MRAIAGADGCPGGWIVAVSAGDGIEWRFAPLGTLGDALRDCAVAGIDMPLGLADRGWRRCDALAREALGPARARVFMTPPRGVLELGFGAPNDVVQERSRALTGQGTSRQAMALAGRILEADALLPDDRLAEVHPELSFAAMAGHVLPSKHADAGRDARAALLGSIFGGIPDGPAPLADRMDALAALWSARRWAAGAATSLPDPPDRDARGVPMRIVT